MFINRKCEYLTVAILCCYKYQGSHLHVQLDFFNFRVEILLGLETTEGFICGNGGIIQDLLFLHTRNRVF